MLPSYRLLPELSQLICVHQPAWLFCLPSAPSRAIDNSDNCMVYKSHTGTHPQTVDTHISNTCPDLFVSASD